MTVENCAYRTDEAAALAEQRALEAPLLREIGRQVLNMLDDLRDVAAAAPELTWHEIVGVQVVDIAASVICGSTPEAAQTTPRPMTGLFASLTPEQQKAALAYDGEENHGDPAFLRNQSPERKA